MRNRLLPKCNCGSAEAGLIARDERWWCPKCIWLEMARLKFLVDRFLIFAREVENVSEAWTEGAKEEKGAGMPLSDKDAALGRVFQSLGRGAIMMRGAAKNP